MSNLESYESYNLVEDNTNSEAYPSGCEKTPESLRKTYRFIKKLGKGSQGTVYLAERISDHRKVAVKQINIQSINSWKQYELFEREAKTLKSLNIQGVAEFYEAMECLDDDPPCAYIVQEYIEGKSIQALLNENQRLEIHAVFDIVIKIINILEALGKHDPPVVHRDIKPSNLILTPVVGGRFSVHLIDFGAVANPQVQGGGSTVAGTFGYMAPEQLTGKPTPASDIYSLAAVIVHLLSGISPADMKVKDFRLMFEPELQSLHPSVVSVLRQMLEPNVQDRLCDITKIKEYFTRFLYNEYDLDKTFEKDKESISDNEFNVKLMEVTKYGEDGNFELYQRLSDVTPRNIPKCYVKNINNLYKLDVGTIDRLNRSIRDRKFKVVKGNLNSFFADALVFLVSMIVGMFLIFAPGGVFLIIFIPFYFIFSKKNTSSFIMGLLGLLFEILTIVSFIAIEDNTFGIIFAVLASILALALAGDYLQNNDSKETMFSDNDFESMDSVYGLAEEYCQEKYFSNMTKNDGEKKKLLQEGRKTVARIVGIRYLQADQNLILKKENNHYPTYYGVPLFKVSYAFNPPDDLRQEDLIHTFYTHDDPSEHLRIGDPLPILYYFEKMEKDELTRFNETPFDIYQEVISMPFPLPLSDPITLNEVIGRSDVQIKVDKNPNENAITF